MIPLILTPSPRFLLTRVPFFKELILAAFECQHCGYRNNSVETAAQVQEEAQRIAVRVLNEKDLNRSVVKGEYASIRVPEIALEIPAATQRGQINTIEGFLTATRDGLQGDQEERAKVDPEGHAKVAAFLARVDDLLSVRQPFTFIIEDPSGNSFVQNLVAPLDDPQLIEDHFPRTKEQNEEVGIGEEEQARDEKRAQQQAEGVAKLAEAKAHLVETPKDYAGVQSYSAPGDEFSRPAGSRISVLRAKGVAEITQAMQAEDLERDVVTFHVPCAGCGGEAVQRMVKIEIPYFKEVIVMAMSCAFCPYRNSEVKVGGAMSARGRRLTLKVTCKEDLSRDVLKSETATLNIPEIDFQLDQFGAMAGRFTTVEGLVSNIRKELSSNPFVLGDSSDGSAKDRFKKFLARLDGMLAGKEPFTLEVDDPLGNSYIQNLRAPEPDPSLTVEDYTRTRDQDEDLGLLDMKTENY